MSSAVPSQQEKPPKSDHSRAGNTKVLKFDRRAGVVLLEMTESPSKPRSIIRLVRDLLAVFCPTGSAVRSHGRMRGREVSIKGRPR